MGILPLLILIVLLVKYWHLVLGALLLYLALRWVVAPWHERRAREARDRLRHVRARQEIDAITFAAMRAMHKAAARPSSDVIESTAVEEVKR
jgi:hypothetical protein